MRSRLIQALWQMVYHRELAVPSKEFFGYNVEIDGNDSSVLDTLRANLLSRLRDEGIELVDATQLERMRSKLGLAEGVILDETGVKICIRCDEPIGWCIRHGCTGDPLKPLNSK